MNYRKMFLLAALTMTACWVTTADSKSANAQETITISRTYKVQVQYWFFDTDYYYWSTKLETSDQSEAQLLYDILLWAKQNGQLNSVVPNSYWRYIAVDVRMRVEYNWHWIQPERLELRPIGFRP